MVKKKHRWPAFVIKELEINIKATLPPFRLVNVLKDYNTTIGKNYLLLAHVFSYTASESM